MKRFALIAGYLLLTVFGLFGTLAVCCGQEPAAKPVRVWTYRFADNFNVPGYPTPELKGRFAEAGSLWAWYANVKFTELGPGKAPDFWVLSRVKAGAWATYSPGYLTFSTWSGVTKQYATWSKEKLDAHFRTLSWHEQWHAMGGKGNSMSTAQMKAWAVSRYGPSTIVYGKEPPKWGAKTGRGEN